jgi:hypothetical protein
MSRGKYEKHACKNWCEATHERLRMEDVWERDSIEALEEWNERVKAAREERDWKKRM